MVLRLAKVLKCDYTASGDGPAANGTWLIPYAFLFLRRLMSLQSGGGQRLSSRSSARTTFDSSRSSHTSGKRSRWWRPGISKTRSCHPGSSDMLVLILWARLGTPLPDQRYRGIDGRIPVTGTEWEFEAALAAHRQSGVLDLCIHTRDKFSELSSISRNHYSFSVGALNARSPFARLTLKGLHDELLVLHGQ